MRIMHQESILIKSMDPMFSKFDEPDEEKEVREGRSQYQIIKHSYSSLSEYSQSHKEYHSCLCDHHLNRLSMSNYEVELISVESSL